MPSTALTAYESLQVAEIAAWKGRKPGMVRRTVEILKRPLDRVLETAIPAERAREWFTRLHRAADWKANRDAVEKALRIDDLTSFRDGPLERCDAAVGKLRDLSREIVTGGSLLAGAGGIATELLALPAEIMLALRTVHRVGACYGYALDDPRDETVVLAVVGLAMEHDPAERLRARRLIRELEERSCPAPDEQRLEELGESRLKEEAGDDLVETLGSSLIEEKLGEGVPILGTALGVVLDNAFISAVEEAARRTFQERWLREHGKVDEIAPTEPETPTLSESVVQATYSTTYALSFGVVFPVALVGRFGARWLPVPVVEGFREGAEVASRDAGRLLAGLRGQPDPAVRTV